MRAILLASATATTLGRHLGQQLDDPGMFVGMGARVTDYGCRADDQQASQVAIALLRYAAEPSPCHQSNSGAARARSKRRTRVPDLKTPGSVTVAAIAVAPITPMPGMVSSRRLTITRAMLGVDAAFELPDLRLQRSELIDERLQGLPHRLGQLPGLAVPASRMIASSVFHPSMPVAATRPTSARWARNALMSCVRWRTSRSRERCSMSAACCSIVLTGTNRMLGRVTASQMRRCIGSIVLGALDVGLHIARGHQPHGMAELRQLACPMMGRRAGLHADEARRQLLEELDHLATPELPSDRPSCPPASTPCTWNTFLARSRPIVVTCMWTAPSLIRFNDHPMALRCRERASSTSSNRGHEATYTEHNSC